MTGAAIYRLHLQIRYTTGINVSRFIGRRLGRLVASSFARWRQRSKTLIVIVRDGVETMNWLALHSEGI